MGLPKHKPETLKITTEHNIHLTLGVSDVSYYPKVIYMRSKATATPQQKKKSHTHDMNQCKEKFSEYVNTIIPKLKNYDGNAYIFSLDASEKSPTYGKKTYIRYDIYLKPNKPQKTTTHFNQLKKLSDRMEKHLLKLLNKNGFDLV